MSVATPVKKAAVKKVKSDAKAPATKKAPVKVSKAKPEVKAKAKPEPKGKKAPVEKATRVGRPPGPVYVPTWIEGLKATPFARKNSLAPVQGLGSLYLRASAEGAPALQNLAKLLKDKDARLVKLLK